MQLDSFEEFLERKGQLTRIQVNILRSDLELLTKYAAYVTRTRGSRLTVADLCQLAIRDYVSTHGGELSDRMRDFDYIPRAKRSGKNTQSASTPQAKK